MIVRDAASVLIAAVKGVANPNQGNDAEKTKTTKAEFVKALADSFSIRRSALIYHIPYYTTLAGALAVTEAIKALRAGVPITTVYVAEGAERDGRLRDAFKMAAEQGIKLLEVSRGELDRMTAGAVHQGLAARIPSFEYSHADDLLEIAAANGEKPLIVALDSVTDPRNLGAVIRSASGFGAHGVLIPERRAAGMTAAAWKSSAGAAAQVNRGNPDERRAQKAAAERNESRMAAPLSARPKSASAPTP